MIKFKQKKCDIIIQKATELRDSLAYEANQEFLKRGDVVVDYLNTKLKDAVAKGNTHCVISELTMVAMLTKKYSLPAEDCYKQWIVCKWFQNGAKIQDLSSLWLYDNRGLC